MMSTKKILQVFPFLWAILLSITSYGQENLTVTGTVREEATGSPIPGVTILVKSTTVGTTTDFDGNFSIEVNPEATLVVSYLGFATQVISINGRTVINIALTTDSQELSEVVVVGYGTVRKSDLTGAVSSITSEQIQERSNVNVMSSLSGQVAGVQIQQTQGAPGYAPVIKIRGTSTITAGINPLYVIDGFPIEGFDMGNINPQNIESIEILKDASSAAIYGSRGGNGVVLITTKKGAVGKTQVSVSYEHGVQQVVRTVDMMNSQEFIQYYVDAHNNSWIREGGSASDPNSIRPSNYQIPPEFLTAPDSFETTDWQDVLFSDAPSDNINLSVSGGNENTRFFISGGYISQEGIVDNAEYNRLSLRSNISHNIVDNLKVGMNLSLANIKSKEYGTTGKAGSVSLSLQNDPIFPVYNENGNLGFKDPNSVWSRFIPYNLQLWHPYALTREIDNLNKELNVIANTFAEYNFLQDFTFRTSYNFTVNNSRYSDYRNEGQLWGYSNYQPALANNNTYYNYNWLFENTLNYNKILGEHTFNVLLGYSTQENHYEESLITSDNFPNDLVHTLNAGKPASASSSESDWSMISYLARLNYSFQDEYLLTATIRRDGSSRFGLNNQWGYFPSGSVAWKLSERDFIKELDWLSTLKLRASYGITGNNLIPNYGAIGLLGQTQYAWGNNVEQGIYKSTISNADLKWEKTGQFDIGLNASLFGNRIYVEADYYSSTTRDLLLNQPVPLITGFAEQLTNIGKVRNRGFEFLVTSKNFVGEFGWQTNFNISINRNEVLELGQNNAPIFVNEWGTTKTEIGEPIANYFGYIFDGVFMNQSEVDNYPHVSSTTPGDPRVKDVNGDGTIDENDRTIIGNAQPDFTFGFTNTFTFKNFDLSATLQGSVGNEILNSQARYNKYYNGNRNGYKQIVDYWKSESNPGDGEHFKPYVSYPGLQTQFSDYWVEDGSYLRIANLRLGYSFSEDNLTRMPFKDARIYINVDNLYVFTDYSGYDPENSTYSDALNTGNDYGAYPLPRTITVGVKLGL